MLISMFLKANVQRLGSYQKLSRVNSLIVPSGVTSLLMPRSSLTTHRGDTHMLLGNTSSELRCYEEGYTSGVWLESESILIKLPKVSEVATNHWVFLRCDWLPNSIWFYYQS